jgi:hypothetical protein
MAAPKVLPLKARRAAWDQLWRILLAPPSQSTPTLQSEHGGGIDRGECGDHSLEQT